MSLAQKRQALLGDMHKARQTGSWAAQAALSFGGLLNSVSENLPLWLARGGAAR